MRRLFRTSVVPSATATATVPETKVTATPSARLRAVLARRLLRSRDCLVNRVVLALERPRSRLQSDLKSPDAVPALWRSSLAVRMPQGYGQRESRDT